jgi:hypothetical protein
MTKFAEPRFSVAVGSKSYRDNFDRIFRRQKNEDVFVCPHGSECVHGCTSPEAQAKNHKRDRR